ERSAGPGDGIDQARWATGAVGADGAGVASGAGGAVEEEGAFLDGPAKIAALYDPVYLFDVILADVAFNEIVGAAAIEGEAVGIAQAHGVDFRHCTGRAHEGITGRNAILAVSADGIGAGGVERGTDGIEAQH